MAHFMSNVGTPTPHETCTPLPYLASESH